MIGKTGIRKNNDAYADDVDTWAGSMDYGQVESQSVMCKLTEGAQKWYNIQDVAAASTAFHKCITQILGHIVVALSLVIDYEFEFEMDLLDIKGARTRIPLVSPDQPIRNMSLDAGWKRLSTCARQQYQCICANTRLSYSSHAVLSLKPHTLCGSPNLR